MTPEAQRIAIAEACGWKDIITDHEFCSKWWNGEPIGVPPINQVEGYKVETAAWELRDYLSDLNAMHEAEKVLTDDQRGDYADNLINGNPAYLNYIFAPASERAEAFLRTIGKWDDNK